MTITIIVYDKETKKLQSTQVINNSVPLNLKIVQEIASDIYGGAEYKVEVR